MDRCLHLSLGLLLLEETSELFLEADKKIRNKYQITVLDENNFTQ